MAITKVTYIDKVDTIINPSPDENKVVANDLNSIKTSVNDTIDFVETSVDFAYVCGLGLNAIFSDITKVFSVNSLSVSMKDALNKGFSADAGLVKLDGDTTQILSDVFEVVTNTNVEVVSPDIVLKDALNKGFYGQAGIGKMLFDGVEVIAGAGNVNIASNSGNVDVVASSIFSVTGDSVELYNAIATASMVIDNLDNISFSGNNVVFSNTGIINASNSKIENVGSPILASDAATKGYADTEIVNAIGAVGLQQVIAVNSSCTTTADIIFDTTNNISHQTDKTFYVESQTGYMQANSSFTIDAGASIVLTSALDIQAQNNVNMLNNRLLNVGDPTATTDGINKGWNDAIQGVGTPVGVVTPRYIGDVFCRTDNNDIFMANGALITNWIKIA